MKRCVMVVALGSALACAAEPDAKVDSPAAVASAPPTVAPAAAALDRSPPTIVAAPIAAPTTTASPVPAGKTAQPAKPVTADIHAEDQGVVVAPKLAQVDTTITLRASGTELVFDPATITLKQGTRVRLRFANMGSFAHNFVVARDDSDLDQLAERARDANENVPLSLKSKMLVFTNIAQPSQTVEAAFVVPPPGEYTYVCLVEGHANIMLGKLRSTR